MASCQRQAFRVTLVVSSLLLVLLSLIIFFFVSSSRAAVSSGHEEELLLKQQKVEVAVYYEALCPYCSYFIAYQLTRIFTDGFLPIVRLRLIPWGNAGLDVNGAFRCQHGPSECLLNTVEACAINVYPDTAKHFFLIQCIESLSYQQREAEWQSCFQKASFDSKPLFDCYNTGRGHQIESQYAYQTNQLNPPHAFVPWVLVNNQPLKEDYRNFISYVCKAYRGSTIPQACHTAQLETKVLYSEEENNHDPINKHNSTSPQVCYPAASFETETSALPPLSENLTLQDRY